MKTQVTWIEGYGLLIEFTIQKTSEK